ncbi:MAG: hypothetical protein ABIR57_05135 [Aeromicrobium sp.]
MPTPLPAELLLRPFTAAEARDLKITAKVLRGSRFLRLFPRVYVQRDLELTPVILVQAALLATGEHAAASHESGLAVWGADIGNRGTVHLSTRRRSPTRIGGITMHRGNQLEVAHVACGCRVLSPERCLVDASTRRSMPDLVTAGDWLIRNQHMTRSSFLTFVTDRHFDGVVRARRIAELLDDCSESPRESLVRMILELSGLPRPICNRTYGDAHEPFARPDMSYPEWKVAIEYDGRQHGLSLSQRTRDVWRRERMERIGWTFIVVTAADLRRPREIVNRVHAALCEHGFGGPKPAFPSEWTQAFGRSA